MTPQQKTRVLELLEAKWDIKKIAADLGVSVSTVYKIRREGQRSRRGSKGSIARHEEALLFHLDGLKHLLRRFTSSNTFPTVWDTPEEVVVLKENQKVVCRLPGEEDPAWPWVEEHLRTSGQSNVLKLAGVWRSEGKTYWELLGRLTTEWTDQARKRQAQAGGQVVINWSEWACRVLQELDALAPREQDCYEFLCAHGRWFVAFLGPSTGDKVSLFEAATKGLAGELAGWHRELRERFRHSPEYQTLRQARTTLQKTAQRLSQWSEAVQMNSYLPGTCSAPGCAVSTL
ncbi:MAG: helix-turn-helix domain-containing protein [Euryarchaeota archaeon]|nr:helix-turn-helix domain-containing protein [Euryarchaeota archaeon]